MKDEMIRQSLLSSALSIFVDEPVMSVEGGEFEDEDFSFYTYSETGDPKEGYIEHGNKGNYNVWLEGKLAYEVEGELFDLLSERKRGLISFYKKIRKIKFDKLKYKSQVFVGIVLDQAEVLIASPLIPVEPHKNIVIKSNYIFSTKEGNKFIINMN
jgi:hypothetical protein